VLHAVRKLRREDCVSTAALLARAFEDNAAYAFLHPNALTRARDLRRFFERNLAWHLGADLTWVVVDASDALIGTATLEPPGGVPHSSFAAIHHWLLPTLLEHGPRGLRRMRETVAGFGAANRATAGSDRYWHVHMVAVDPARQRSGAGTTLLNHVFRELDALLVSQPAPVVLNTQRESNLRLYERYGFEERGRFRIGGAGPDAFESWRMRRR
jgi:ribosomal protein S18 acetylase RimI-like enzyme